MPDAALISTVQVAPALDLAVIVYVPVPEATVQAPLGAKVTGIPELVLATTVKLYPSYAVAGGGVVTVIVVAACLIVNVPLAEPV